jgi:hypothetical protein
MDYVLHGYELLAHESRFSERLVRLKTAGVLQFPHPEDDPQFAPLPRDKDAPVRVAVRANGRKLNGPFLNACLRIQEASRRPFEFHFFPFETPFWMHAIRLELERLGLRAVIHAPAPYRAYRDALAACDLSISPFPYGNAVSTVDALLLRMPVVAMIGPEPHERTDARLLRVVGLGDWLFEREEDYCAAAVRLIESAELRAEISASLGHVRQILFETEHENHAGEFAQALYWTFENHEAIQRADLRAIGPRDWSENL